jgi:hypothetical protein
MNELIEKFKKLTTYNLDEFSCKERLSYYIKATNSLDKVMDNKDIDLQDYKKLMEIKKIFLAKIYALEEDLD